MKKIAQFIAGFVFGIFLCISLFLFYVYLNPMYPNA
jgi:hypothetical protein